MATLDHAKCQALLEAAIVSGVSGLTYVPMHETPAEGAAPYVQLVAFDFTPVHQQDDAENDAHEVTVTANVAVGRGVTSGHGLAGALEIVRRAMDRLTVDDSGTSGHVCRLDRARASQDPAPFGARTARTGAVIVTGRVQRASGSDRTDYLS